MLNIFRKKKPENRLPVKNASLHVYGDDEHDTSVFLYRSEIAGVQQTDNRFQLLLKHGGYRILFQARDNDDADQLLEQIGDCMSETRPNVSSYAIAVRDLHIVKE